MFFHAVGGWLPILYLVARRAFALVRARGELPVMRILVAIHALGKRNLRLEVATFVALAARDRLVFSEQGEFRFLVVETHQLRHVLPTRSHVATLARRSEAALVRVG